MLKDIAEKYYIQGYNCAESVLYTLNDELDLQLPPEALRMATGFGGGVGRSGCMCGALSAATMVLGALEGRTNTEKPLAETYSLTHAFHDIFKDHFKGTCCRVLNKAGFATPEHRKTCSKITTETSELLQQFIEEKGICK